MANFPGIDRTWPLLTRLMAGHTAIYRASGGRIGRRIPGVGLPMLLLDHVGAKSGIERTSPLLYLPDGDDLVIVASKGGYPQHPAWFHNLMANPDVAVQVQGERLPVHAREAKPAEYDRLWKLAVAGYRGYEDYAARSKGRKIPLVVLEPR